MGIDTVWVSIFEATLRGLNRLPVGEREVSVAGKTLFPYSADRLIAAWKWKLSWTRSAEARFLRATVQPGMRVADVGANIGLHTTALARLVGPTGRVVAVEPEPQNFMALSRAVERGGYEQVLLRRAAAGARPGSLSLYVSAANRGDHRSAPAPGQREEITVECQPLDGLFGDDPRLDFLKLDVQGAEADVFAGMATLLERNPNLVITSELSPALLAAAGADFDGYFGPLERADFAPHLLEPTAELRPIEARTAWELAERAGYCDLVFRRSR
ncbi:MAG: FkbM family methyltransferase [Myxococcota bacterium]|nr:FkbM family methyltransferase [Myxococcota bacterium]